MTTPKPLTCRWLFAAFLLLPLLMLPGDGFALENVPEGEWAFTEEAEQRTLAGDCPPSKLCLEWCLSGEPTGEFMCFDHVPQSW